MALSRTNTKEIYLVIQFAPLSEHDDEKFHVHGIFTILNQLKPCPSGTFGDSEGNVVVGDCVPCPAGFNCEAEGISDLSEHYCPAGYYCLTGTVIYFTRRSVFK